MKKLLMVLATITFILGFLLSGFLTHYFLAEGEYIEDVLIINDYTSARVGAIEVCAYKGKLLSNNRESGLSCDIIRDLVPTERLQHFINNIGQDTLLLSVYTNTIQGGAHVFLESNNQYSPGVLKRRSIWSYTTFLLLPLPILLLYFWGGKRFKSNKTLIALLLSTFSLLNIHAQSSPEDTLVSFQVRTVVQRTIEVEIVAYDSLQLKKTNFDTSYYRLQYPEECLLCQISATNNATLQYCTEVKDTEKKPQHYRSIEAMHENDLYLQPTLKLTLELPNETVSWIKLYYVDNIRNRKIRSVKKIVKRNGRWQMSSDQLDAEIALVISGIKDEALMNIFLRRLDPGSDLYNMQEQCYADGTMNLRTLAKAYGAWFIKGQERTDLIDKYGENLIQ